MSVEILTVSLSDESIARLADAVASRLSTGSIGFSSPEPQRTQPAEVSPAPADPWAPDYPTSAAPAQPAAPAMNGSPAAPSGAVTRTISTKYGVQTWQLNMPGAPLCGCGVPAGLVTKISQAGNRYSKFQCAKRAGDDWRTKCEYDEFPPKR